MNKFLLSLFATMSFINLPVLAMEEIPEANTPYAIIRSVIVPPEAIEDGLMVYLQPQDPIVAFRQMEIKKVSKRISNAHPIKEHDFNYVGTAESTSYSIGFGKHNDPNNRIYAMGVDICQPVKIAYPNALLVRESRGTDTFTRIFPDITPGSYQLNITDQDITLDKTTDAPGSHRVSIPFTNENVRLDLITPCYDYIKDALRDRKADAEFELYGPWIERKEGYIFLQGAERYMSQRCRQPFPELKPGCVYDIIIHYNRNTRRPKIEISEVGVVDGV